MDPRDARVAAENWRRLEARLAAEAPAGGEPASEDPARTESQVINDLIRGRVPRNRLMILYPR
ncbi:hypothetical protein DYH09_35515 [bacterium CPR1]|nr:hypothetical protein [bacterium CPR1]